MKSQALIVYLADAAPRPVSRDALVELLWERVGPQQGKGSLRQELRRIKKALGDGLFASVFDVTDNHVALRQDRFDYDGAAAQTVAASDDAEEIASLLEVCQGDFLESNAARAENFQQWAMERREYLKDMTLAALARLGFMDLEAGRAERAQTVADRMNRIDTLHERGHEIMIRAHLAQGRKGQARAHFERFRAHMLRELATEPEAEIAALVTPRPAEAQAKPAAAPAPAARNDPDPADFNGGERPVIAVLNASSRRDDEQIYLAEGVVEQLVSNLSRSAWIRVAALNVAPYPIAGEEVDRAQRDIRSFADYVLRVDVRVVGKQVAISARLTRVTDNATVFSDQMEARMEDLLALQRQVAIRIASIFEPLVIDDQSKREAGIEWNGDDPGDVNHWRLLMRARWLFWTLRKQSNDKARTLLLKALEIRPDDTPTLCQLAFTHLLDAWSDWSPDVAASVVEARRWATRAVKKEPNDGWAQFTLGVAHSSPDKLAEAKSRVRQSLMLTPSLVIAYGELGRLHVFDGEVGEAKRYAEEALAMSPYDQQAGLWIRTQSIAAWIEEDHAAALDLIDYGLIVRPGWFQNHFLRAAILAETGEVDAARAALAQGRQMVGDYGVAALRFGHPFRDSSLFERFASALNRADGGFEV